MKITEASLKVIRSIQVTLGPNTLCLIGSLFLSLVLTGCNQDTKGPDNSTNKAPVAEEISSHVRMLRELKSIERKSKKGHPFLGRDNIDEMLEHLPRLDGETPEFQFRFYKDLAERELRYGLIEEALLHFAAAKNVLMENSGFFTTDELPGILLSEAIGFLRLAESENCLNCEDGAACLVPVSVDGVHQNRRGSEGAINNLRQVLQSNPENYTAKWLWNVAAMTLGEYPDGVPDEHRIDPSHFKDSTHIPRFQNVAKAKGIDTLSLSGGVICDDLTGEGHLDLMVSDWSASGQLRLYSGDGKGNFTETTKSANLNGIFGGLNLVHADYDNDGDSDVLVLRGAWAADQGKIINSLLQNDGTGKFTDVTFDVGLGSSRFPTQTAAWADYDLDGDLDLYIGNEDFPNELFQNDGTGNFIEVALNTGIADANYTKSVTWGDFNNDRYPDLYISNYYNSNRLYVNNGDGTFRDETDRLKVAGPKTSFPSWFWDVNNDGNLDLFVGSYPMDMDNYGKQYFPETAPRPDLDHLYLGNPEGGFTEQGEEFGLTQITDPMGCNFGDIDNDGYLDFYLGTGAPPFQFLVPNVMYHNQNGQSFESSTYSAGFGHLQKGHGVAFADLDNDGDQDVFQVLGGAFPGDAFHNAYFENPGNKNHWIKFKFIGSRSNRSAIGTRIKLEFTDGEKSRKIFRWINSGASFGANPFLQHIGVGGAKKIDLVEIYWPCSDTTQSLTDVDVDQLMTITEPDPEK